MIDHLKDLWPKLMPEHPNLSAIQPVSQSRHHTVWRITAHSQHFIAKQHLFASLTQGKPYDLQQVEKRVTQCLHQEGVSVPNILATHPELGLTIYEWCGDHTLDDLYQQAQNKPVTAAVFTALVALERGFETHTNTLETHIAPGCSQSETREDFAEITNTLTEILPNLLHIFTPKTLPNLHHHWQTILHHLEQAPLSLGPTDYNARNIVISPTGQPHILELSKIGYDWPERRLIQYTTSLGAQISDGHIVNQITPQNAQTYANETAQFRHTNAENILTTLDAHHLIFFLFAALQCLQAHEQPDHPYQNIETRLRQIHQALALPLSNNNALTAIRTLCQ